MANSEEQMAKDTRGKINLIDLVILIDLINLSKPPLLKNQEENSKVKLKTRFYDLVGLALERRGRV